MNYDNIVIFFLESITISSFFSFHQAVGVGFLVVAAADVFIFVVRSYIMSSLKTIDSSCELEQEASKDLV